MIERRGADMLKKSLVASLGLVLGLAPGVAWSYQIPAASAYSNMTDYIYFNIPVVIKTYCYDCVNRAPTYFLYHSCIRDPNYFDNGFFPPANHDPLTFPDLYGDDSQVCNGPLPDFPSSTDTGQVDDVIWVFHTNAGYSGFTAEIQTWDGTHGHFTGTGYCIDVPNGTSSQVNLQVYSCNTNWNTNSNQRWNFDQVVSDSDDGTEGSAINNGYSSPKMCFDLPDNDDSDLEQYSCQGNSDQSFQFQYLNCKAIYQSCTANIDCCSNSCVSGACQG
jgi:hypothetical protein